MGRAEVRDRILGQTEKNGLAEVEEGTEVMGIKWMSPHWIYDNGKEVRRINYVKDHWEFEDGTRPERVYPGLKEIPGHWESQTERGLIRLKWTRSNLRMHSMIGLRK